MDRFDSEFDQRQLPNSTAVLVLGICSIVTCFCAGIPGLICGIIALVLSKKDMALYNESPENWKGYQNLKAGRICAIIGLVLSTLYLIYYIGIIAFGISSGLLEEMGSM